MKGKWVLKNDEKVSIIIPVYNVEKYLKKCIESIINQKYKNIEILLIDDGSIDNSGKICDNYAYKDSRITVLHKENNGVSSARNLGLAHANGEYICFIDGDDFAMDDYVEYMLYLIKRENADIALCTKMFGNFDNEQSKNENIKVLNAEETTEAILNYKIPIGVYSKLFKTELIKKYNICFFEELFMGEGFNFNVACFQRANKIAISNRKIYYYRRDNSTSATTKFSIEKCENSLYAIELMKSKFIIQSNRILNSWKYAKWRTYSDAYDYICLGKGKRDSKEKYNEYKKYIKKNFFIANKVNISKKDKLRAYVMGIFPESMPLILKLRRLKYKIKI